MYKKDNLNKNIFRYVLIALILIPLIFTTNIYAYRIKNFIAIRVKQNIVINSDFSKPKDRFNYIIEATTKFAPLPNNSKDTYEFTLRGEEEKLLEIEYQKEGTYSYKIYQIENEKLNNVTQDKEIYTLNVQVTNTKDGLVAKYYMIVNSYNFKVTDMKFTNRYNFPENNNDNKIIKSPYTGDSSNIIMSFGIIQLSIFIFVVIYKKNKVITKD